MLVVAVLCVSSALLIYSGSVWVPWFRRRLEWWAVVGLWVGLVLDSTGTILMSILAGGWKPTFHGWTGIVGNSLMVALATVATVSRRRGPVERPHGYFALSLVLWVVWLVPMLGGAVFGGRS